jgi:quinolinate synthase
MAGARAVENLEALGAQLAAVKQRLGRRLLVLAHHYQRPEVVAAGDVVGDSYEISKKASESDAELIVFCGVRFMAESARILARPDQRVFHPNPWAGCPLADMADPGDATRLHAEIAEIAGPLAPLCYMNSSAEVKAFTGRNGGSVFTSSNADKAITWGLERSGRVLVMPDEHLGRNTAARLGVPEAEVVLVDPGMPLGGRAPDEIRRGRVFLWKGFCHVHTWFTPGMVAVARARLPGCKVVVHPECPAPVVAAADAAGSTGFIVKYVRDAGPGSVTVVGTELNLVSRLASEWPDRKVVSLSRSLCPNMFRISLGRLAETLRALPDRNEVTVPEAVAADAALALRRMLEMAG